MSFVFAMFRRSRFNALGFLALLCCAALTGCPGGKPAGGGGKSSGADGAPAQSEEELTYQSGKQLSLFNNTPLTADPPDAIGFSRDGSRLYARGVSTADAMIYVLRFDVGSAGLTPGGYQISDPQFMVPAIAVAPNGAEVLVQSQWQPGGKLVRDVLWRLSDTFAPEFQGRSGVPYDRSSGLPVDGPIDTFMGLKPFYSWDGQTVIVPLNHLGLCTVDLRSGSGEYTPYPALPFEQTGMALGALPDEAGHSRIYASFWSPGLQEDSCEVYVLDLQTRAWEKVFALPWIAKAFGVSSVFDAPWLVSGTRPAGEQLGEGASHTPQDGQQGKRVQRVALIVPRAGTPEILEIWGNPAGDLALEAHGEYFAYMDRNRRGMVRVRPASGELDLDDRWFSNEPDLRVFISAGGTHTFFWKRDILIEARWKKQEKHKGYAAGAGGN
jgi:hypothetical protein